MKIIVLYNVPTRRSIKSSFSETDVDTEDSALEVTHALTSRGFSVQRVAIDEDHIDAVDGLDGDCLFNLVEWTGLDLPLVHKVFDHIEKLGIPYTGATRENYVTTADKSVMKKLFDVNHLPTARWQIFQTGREAPRNDFVYPVIVKPALEHCSIGLTADAVVADAQMLKTRVRERISTFAESMVVEEFITGREFQVTVLETLEGILVLPPAEIVFDTQSPQPMLTYNSRWNESTVEYKTSHVRINPIDAALDAKIREVVLSTFTHMGFHDYTRLDIRTRDQDIYILEANSNPGLGDDEEYGMTLSYKAVGMTFADVVAGIVQSAMRRFRPKKAV